MGGLAKMPQRKLWYNRGVYTAQFGPRSASINRPPNEGQTSEPARSSTSRVGLADRDYMKSEKWQREQKEKRASWFRRPRWARWRELRDDAWIPSKPRRG